MRDCPTVEGSSIPLIVHRIAADDCMARQSCHYHKCHRCIYRGQAASWQPEGLGEVELPRGLAPRTAEREVPSKTVAVPLPIGVAAQKKPAASKPAAKKPAVGKPSAAKSAAAKPARQPAPLQERGAAE